MTKATAGHVHRAIIAAVVALVLSTALAVPAEATETENRITRADLLAAPIPSVCGMQPTHLVDGVHPDSDTFPDPGPAAAIFGHGFLTGAPQKIRTGDFTGDGVADGLIVVGCNQTNQIELHHLTRLHLPAERHLSGSRPGDRPRPAVAGGAVPSREGRHRRRHDPTAGVDLSSE